jgi:hypothetical protein
VNAVQTTTPTPATRQLRVLARPHRFRVTADPEGFPMIPGRLGRIEWYCDGIDCHGCPLPGELALAVWCDRARLFPKLWTIPGVRRWQTGDTEIRAVFPVEALDQVAGVIRARRRRTLSPEAARHKGAGTAYRATSRVLDGSGRGPPHATLRAGADAGGRETNAMKCTALALLIAFAATLVGCSAVAPASAPSRLPCESLSACDGLYAGNR